MFVTVEEASGKWCPFGRQPTLVNAPIAFVSANRQPNGDVPSCLGPLCMAWRFAEAKQLREISMLDGEVMDEQPRRGYCGLSGKPDHGD